MHQMAPTFSAPPGAKAIASLYHGTQVETGSMLPPQIIQYWYVAVRRRYLILGVILATLAAAVVITMLTAPVYTAKARIQISRAQKNITNVQGLDDPNRSGGDEFYETQYALLKARSVADRVVSDQSLSENADFFAAHGQKFEKIATTPRKDRQDRAADLLINGIVIVPVRRSSLVDISYQSRSPEWSAKIANAWPQAFIAQSIDQQVSSTADARRYLDARLSALRARLQDSQHGLVTFGNEHNIVTLSSTRDASGRTEESRTLVGSNLDALNSALGTARAERIAAESRLEAGSEMDTLADSTIGGLRSKRVEVAADYARLITQFEPGYPAARALKAQMDTLDAAIAAETRRAVNSRRQAFDEARRRETVLAGQVEAAKAQFVQQQRDTIQYGMLQREVATTEQLFDSLLQRYKDIGVAGSVGATNIVLIDQAQVPGGPTSPNLRQNILQALLIGIALSAAIVFALEMIDEGIRTPAEVENNLGLHLLGSIPRTSALPHVKLSNPKSTIAEAYFSVQTALSLSTSHGFPRSVMVTSTHPEEGKSITALAIAVAVGRTGRRVLLVDADLRSPSIHKLVEMDNTHGLSNILAGEQNISSIITETSLKGLSILPAGPQPPNPAELFSTGRLDNVLAVLLKHYDHVVFDSAPVIGIADAPLLARAVEGCIFVIKSEKVAVRTIRSALRRLQFESIRIFGAVVTMIDANRHGYGYGYAYGYGYGQSKTAETTV